MNSRTREAVLPKKFGKTHKSISLSKHAQRVQTTLQMRIPQKKKKQQPTNILYIFFL